MPELDYGIQELTDADRAYAGSRFREVVDALFANPYQRVWGAKGSPPSPYMTSLYVACSEESSPL